MNGFIVLIDVLIAIFLFRLGRYLSVIKCSSYLKKPCPVIEQEITDTG